MFMQTYICPDEKMRTRVVSLDKCVVFSLLTEVMVG